MSEDQLDPKLHGLGVRILPHEPAVEFLFEIQGLAEDSETGEPAPAATKIKMGLKPGATLKTLEEYEAISEDFRQGHFNVPKEDVRRITWAEYLEYDLDGEEVEP